MPDPQESNVAPAAGGSPSRRRFLGWVSGLGAGLVGVALAGLTAGFLSSSRRRAATARRVLLARWEELPAEGFLRVAIPLEVRRGWRTVSVGVTVYARREGEGGAVAFSGRCTHMGCTVRWSEGENQFVCPCHEGRFTAAGDVVSGPVPRPLDRLPLVIEDGEIHVEIREPR